MTALRLIIENHPSWHPPAAREDDDVALPAQSYKIYTVLGRRNLQWHTIVPRIDDFSSAMTALDSANRSQLFDRLVLAVAQTVAGQPATRWETTVCAVPYILRQADKPSFEAVLSRVQRQGRTLNLPQNDNAPTTDMIDNRGASLFLIVLLLTGLWSQTWPVLAGVAALCLFEMAWQAGWLNGLILPTQRPLLRTLRFYLYALCAGLAALPLITAQFLQI
jgi:hypothetical protein